MKKLVAVVLILMPLKALCDCGAFWAIEDEEERYRSVEAMREEVNNKIPEAQMKMLCSNSVVDNDTAFPKIAGMIRKHSSSNQIGDLSLGEFIYLSNCDGRNAFENNIYPTNLQYTPLEGVSPLTRFMVKEMGPLLALKGPSGKTPLEYIDEQIKFAYDAESRALAGAYYQLKQLVMNRLEEVSEASQ